MHRKRFSLLVSSATVLLASPAAGLAQDVDLSGQLRPRFEARDAGPGTSSEFFTSMRLRLGVQAELERSITVYAELQDVRVFGEESSTLADFQADGLDLHQGYISAQLGRNGAITAKVGRQETNLGGQRLVGAVGWTQQGRSFDGARVSARGGWGGLDLIAYKLSETDRTDRTTDAEFLGAYSSFDTGGGDLELYGFLNRSDAGGETSQGTLGGRFDGSAGRVRYRFEGATQTGTRQDLDVSAFMIGARGGITVDEERSTITLWWDYLSGDDDGGDGEIKVFDTLFATNHKFYGFADVFLNIPLHTGGRGLQDLALKVDRRFRPGTRLAADLHSFRASESLGLTTASLGTELDLTLSHRYSREMTVTLGFSQLWTGDGLVEIGRLSGDLTFGYVMVDVRF